MRTWTLVLSVCAHALAIGVLVVAPIFATSDLPNLRRPLTFAIITPIDVPTVPVTPRPQPAQTSTATQSIPVTEPTDLPPDVPAPDAPPPKDVVHHSGTGVPTDGFPPVGNPVIAPPQAAARKDPLPVGGVIRPPTRITYVEPIYPQIALASRVQGTVILQAVIDETGSVRELRVLRGHPLLDAAAMQAVAKWQFTPTLLNGTTVPVVMTVTVSFTLTK
jgi:protein TonB